MASVLKVLSFDLKNLLLHSVGVALNRRYPGARHCIINTYNGCPETGEDLVLLAWSLQCSECLE